MAGLLQPQDAQILQNVGGQPQSAAPQAQQDDKMSYMNKQEQSPAPALQEAAPPPSAATTPPSPPSPAAPSAAAPSAPEAPTPADKKTAGIPTTVPALEKAFQHLSPEELKFYASKFNEDLPDFDKKMQEAQDLYREQVSQVGAKQALASTFSLLGQIAVGMYGVQHGVDTSGIKFDPFDWSTEYNRILQEYKFNQELRMQSLKEKHSATDRMFDFLSKREQERVMEAHRTKEETFQEEKLNLEKGWKQDELKLMKDRYNLDLSNHKDLEKFRSTEEGRKVLSNLASKKEKQAELAQKEAERHEKESEMYLKSDKLADFQTVGELRGLGNYDNWKAKAFPNDWFGKETEYKDAVRKAQADYIQSKYKEARDSSAAANALLIGELPSSTTAPKAPPAAPKQVNNVKQSVYDALDTVNKAKVDAGISNGTIKLID